MEENMNPPKEWISQWNIQNLEGGQTLGMPMIKTEIEWLPFKFNLGDDPLQKNKRINY